MIGKRIDVAERIADLALAEPYEHASLTIRGYAATLLDTGYPRDTLYEDFERARPCCPGAVRWRRQKTPYWM